MDLLHNRIVVIYDRKLCIYNNIDKTFTKINLTHNGESLELNDKWYRAKIIALSHCEILYCNSNNSGFYKINIDTGNSLICTNISNNISANTPTGMDRDILYRSANGKTKIISILHSCISIFDADTFTLETHIGSPVYNNLNTSHIDKIITMDNKIIAYVFNQDQHVELHIYQFDEQQQLVLIDAHHITEFTNCNVHAMYAIGDGNIMCDLELDDRDHSDLDIHNKYYIINIATGQLVCGVDISKYVFQLADNSCLLYYDDGLYTCTSNGVLALHADGWIHREIKIAMITYNDIIHINDYGVKHADITAGKSEYIYVIDADQKYDDYCENIIPNENQQTWDNVVVSSEPIHRVGYTLIHHIPALLPPSPHDIDVFSEMLYISTKMCTNVCNMITQFCI
ncbi:MAG: hypothetical protein Faunusvirus19_4 [Faunusvirus sp.]|jgi:hypothetical protein|uniref:Uncharacterized protein n=1 Tax=Faunusvirus sp. TaxID=2487766 RepID=A0A3G4ZYW7_9VIRU|nr:MAG: hypothetical protein Faunusvirus19_4 [Faunusvirus sp.]